MSSVLEYLSLGFSVAFTATNLLVAAIGSFLGTIVGVLPGLKVMPPPQRDNPGRPPVMILVHVVYGATLGWLVNRWVG